MALSMFDLAQKVSHGGKLSDADARQLAATTDLVTVGMVAAEARRVHGGDRVTYVRVAEIACGTAANSGAASGDAAKADAADGHGTNGDAATSHATGDHASAAATWPAAAREIRITGVPASVDEAMAAVRAVVARAEGRPVTGFSLVDLWTLAGSMHALQDLAVRLADAGLAAIADVPLDRVMQAGVDPRALFAALKTAGLAAPVARWDGMPEDPVAALKDVHALQAETNAFRAFAPLPRALETEPPPTGYDGVKLIALARVMLDNVSAIQVDWVRHGPKLAQVALLFGASDLDRVSPSDDSPLGHRRAPLEEVQRNIHAAFLQPLERDGRFDVVSR